MTDAWHPARWPASVAVPLTWAAYAVLLLATLPFTPLGVLWMLGPLLVTGWYAKDWIVPAAVGLGHGLVLAALVIWLRVFPLELSDPALPLAAGLLVLVSWFTTIAGRTIRLVSVVREQYAYLEDAQRKIDQNAASVEAVWDASSAALITLDSSAHIRSWNPGAEAVFKRTAESMLGRPFQDLALADDPDDCTVPLLYALEKQRSTPPFEGRLLDGRGQILDVEVRARPVQHPGGDPGLIITVVDRTREHIMEGILQEQAERQDRLLQNLEEVLYSVEVPSRQTGMLTKTVETLTGQSIGAFGDFQDFLDLAHPDDRELVANRWEHARSGEKSSLRWRIRTSTGAHVWIEDRVVPVRDEEGRVTRVDGIIRRIFQEIELERQAQRMMRWLDALEPLAGTGAWSLDLRSQEWTWSSGMAALVGSDKPSFEHWSRCVTTGDLALLQNMVSYPETFEGPERIHMIAADGQPQAFVLEAWLQRGNDGEPIHLYGVLHQENGHLARPGTASLVAPPLPQAAIDKAWPPEEAAVPDAEDLIELDEPTAPVVEVEEDDLEAVRSDAPLEVEAPREPSVEPEETLPTPVEAGAPGVPYERAPEATPSEEPAQQRATLHQLDEEEPAGVESVEWDDDVGWVPKMKPQPLVPQTGKDEAEEVAAKQWPEGAKKKPKGPWSLD